MTIIGLKELRQNATQIAERAMKGESFTVVKRSKPVFNITPPTNLNAGASKWVDQYIVDNELLLKSLKDK